MNTPRPVLAISAGPNVLGSRWGSRAERPEGQRHALGAYTRRGRIEAAMWAARVPVIRKQLRAMRGTWG